MTHVRFDYTKALTFFGEHELTYLRDFVKVAHHSLHEKTGAGSDFLGWIDLPEDYDKEEFLRIQKAAEKIKSDSEVLLVIGIGGSYLGARAAVEMLQHSFYNALPKEKRKTPQIIFVGNNISSTYIMDIMDLLEGKDFSINVISKSGTTTEPAIAFRLFRRLIEEKYGVEEARKRIYATTDEIHSDIVYKPFMHYPIASLSPELSKHTVTFIAPSKTFNLAGLHASAIIVEEPALRKRLQEVFAQQGSFSINTFGMICMEAAYQDGEAWLERLIDYLHENKIFAIDYLQKKLPQINCVDPEGTYLLWLDCRKLGLGDSALQNLLIHKGKVALEPGPKYGAGGEGFVRLNFGCPLEVLEDGLKRILLALG